MSDRPRPRAFVEGVALRCGQRLVDRPMVIATGAVAAGDLASAPLFLRHADDGGVRVADCVRLDASPVGLEARWRIDDGMARPLFELIEGHGWRSLSIGFTFDPADTERVTWHGDDVIFVHRAKLHEVALVQSGASGYAGLTRWWRPPTLETRA